MIRLRDLMRRNVEWAEPRDLLRDAARKMESANLALLPVCENRRLVGVLRQEDVETFRRRNESRMASTPVRVLMRTDVICGNESQDMREVVRLMREKEIRILPVLDGVRRLVGIYSFGI
ncbi:MAG TPA: CBS domain-containing protein [Planctomycetota bacterium]|nr:CBS domain-containing protein [Planctomycetota bacterium]